MSDKKSNIIIKIDDHIYRFKAGDQAAIRKLPWQQRKQLIELLSDIKQAEFVKPEKAAPKDAEFDAPNSTADKTITSIQAAQSNSVQTIKPKATKAPQPQSVQVDTDVDDLMNRLIVEQKQTRSSVPDKSDVYKWLLLVIVVIFVLAMVF